MSGSGLEILRKPRWSVFNAAMALFYNGADPWVGPCFVKKKKKKTMMKLFFRSLAGGSLSCEPGTSSPVSLGLTLPDAVLSFTSLVFWVRHREWLAGEIVLWICLPGNCLFLEKAIWGDADRSRHACSPMQLLGYWVIGKGMAILVNLPGLPKHSFIAAST